MATAASQGTARNAAEEAASKIEAPFGLWESEITKEAVFSSSWNLSSPRVDRQSGRAFFLESRPDGVTYIVELSKDGSRRDVLPSGYSARSRVYEYGGAPYAVFPGGDRIIFTNAKDQDVYVVDVDTGGVRCLVKEATLRYGDYDVHPNGQPWVLAVEEDHEIDTPDQVQNYVVAIHAETGAVKRLVVGGDFYMFPAFSHDGKKVCWTTWNFPGMPWAGVRLVWADWLDGASLVNAELVAGHEKDKSVTEPRWGVDGYLYYCQEQTEYRQIYRRKPDEKESTLLKLTGFEEVEFGSAKMGIGSHSYAVLSKSCLVVSYSDNGLGQLLMVNPETLATTRLHTSFSEIHFDGVERLSDNSLLVIGSGSTSPEALCRIDITDGDAKETVLRYCTDTLFPPTIFSKPEHIQVPSKTGPERTIHGFFWPPHNPKFKGLHGEKPPLVVLPHGGPTAHTPPGLKLPYQYWTSRGYALFALNYSGSDGHGKTYRSLLNGRWGSIDNDDVAESVQYLISTSRVDGSRIGIQGRSAGGYSVLAALCTHPSLFAAGVSLYGISDVALLVQETHKMESRYADMLLFTPDMSAQDREKVMRDRSPVCHAGNITAPLLLMHGEDDKVVPISHAYTMYSDIAKRGGDVKLVKFPGEGHGFRRGESQMKAMEEEEQWWKRTLVIKT